MNLPATFLKPSFKVAVMALLTLVFVASAFASIHYGQIGQEISFSEIFQTFLSKNESLNQVSTIIWDIRMPRIILSILVGSNLAVAGLLMQALFQNPMAEPYVVGVSGGASLGAVLAFSLGHEALYFALNGVTLAAFIGAFVTTFCIYTLSRYQRKSGVSHLLLTGIAVGGLMQSLTTLILLQSNDSRIQSILSWLMGSLAYQSWSYIMVLLPYSLVGLVTAAFLAPTLNILASGEETAHHLGVNVERIKIILLVISSLLAASAVAACGIIGFVGLIIPHLMRMILGANHRILLPASILAGSILMIWSDFIARNIAPGQEMPIGVVTGVVGSLFFIYLLIQSRGRVS